jgi:hypothetical protein
LSQRAQGASKEQHSWSSRQAHKELSLLETPSAYL